MQDEQKSNILKKKGNAREAMGLKERGSSLDIRLYCNPSVNLVLVDPLKITTVAMGPPSVLYPWPLNISSAAAGQVSDLSILVLPLKIPTHTHEEKKKRLYNYTCEDLHRANL